MSNQELAVYFVNWLAHRAETTQDPREFAETVEFIRQHKRFKKLPALMRGQIEGFAVGVIAQREGLVG